MCNQVQLERYHLHKVDKSFSEISVYYPKTRIILLSVVSVFLGGLIYVFFRPSEPIFFNWFNSLGVGNYLDFIREKSTVISPFMPEWIVFSLPNGLWAFAYTLLIICVWQGSKSFVKYFWFVSIPVLIFGAEFLQLSGNLPGTFCWNDILSGGAGIIAGVITQKLVIKSVGNKLL
jgi:hypothetical protein